MKLIIEERQSDSPFVERIWHARNDGISAFTSIAVNQCDLVVWTQHGKTQIALHGPETKASPSPVPEEAEFFGIIFKIGVLMPPLPPIGSLIDSMVLLPEAGDKSFWLQGAAWEYPTYDNADTFIQRLVHDGLIYHESIVNDVLRGHLPDTSLRTIQRRFLRAAGLTYNTIHQIERARQATILLQQGVSILDTVEEMGYFDQPHLTRALRHFIGQTPAQILDKSKAEQLSFLYKTTLSG